MSNETQLTFGGATFSPELDESRLTTAMGKIYELMRDGRWRTHAEIAAAVGCAETGASARLRDFRKPEFAEYGVRDVPKRRVQGGGLWEYRLVLKR